MGWFCWEKGPLHAFLTPPPPFFSPSRRRLRDNIADAKRRDHQLEEVLRPR